MAGPCPLLRVRNFGAIGSLDIGLSGFTLICGPSGSGLHLIPCCLFLLARMAAQGSSRSAIYGDAAAMFGSEWPGRVHGDRCCSEVMLEYAGQQFGFSAGSDGSSLQTVTADSVIGAVFGSAARGVRIYPRTVRVFMDSSRGCFMAWVPLRKSRGYSGGVAESLWSSACGGVSVPVSWSMGVWRERAEFFERLAVELDSGRIGSGVLVVDSPEAGFHPASVGDLVELLAFAVASGLKVVVLTDDDCVVGCVRALFLAGSLPEETRARCGMKHVLTEVSCYVMEPVARFFRSVPVGVDELDQKMLG